MKTGLMELSIRIPIYIMYHKSPLSNGVMHLNLVLLNPDILPLQTV